MLFLEEIQSKERKWKLRFDIDNSKINYSYIISFDYISLYRSVIQPWGYTKNKCTSFVMPDVHTIYSVWWRDLIECDSFSLLSPFKLTCPKELDGKLVC